MNRVSGEHSAYFVPFFTMTVSNNLGVSVSTSVSANVSALAAATRNALQPSAITQHAAQRPKHQHARRRV